MDEFEPLSFEDELPPHQGRKQPSFRAIYRADLMRQEIDGARVTKGLSKAELARLVGREPAAIRRLLTADGFNPGLVGLIELAEALGLEVTLEKRKKPGHRRRS
jgi:ribosome-binding protein aMBF1 (putative translation factor)